MFDIWEVREDGHRIAHCGSLRSATDLVSMGHRRTIHRLTQPIQPETVTVHAETTWSEKSLVPQLVLQESNLEPLDLN